MTLEEWEANSKQIRFYISESLEWKPRGSRELDLMMKGISLLLEGLSSLNSRLAEIETLLSTSMPGSEKQSEKQSVTGSREIYPNLRLRSW